MTPEPDLPGTKRAIATISNFCCSCMTTQLLHISPQKILIFQVKNYENSRKGVESLRDYINLHYVPRAQMLRHCMHV